MEGSVPRLIAAGFVGTLLGFTARHLLFQSKRAEGPVNCKRCQASAAATSVALTTQAQEIKELKEETNRLQTQLSHKDNEVHKLKATLNTIATKVRGKATAHTRLIASS
jgi:predicted RNase H-like nuclease (RuvC/YqgF family)